MTVQELKKQLSMLNDDSEIFLYCLQIHGAIIKHDFKLETDDSNDKSPVYLEIQLDRDVCVSGY